MSKKKLSLDMLTVESFQTTPDDDASKKGEEGTVFGYQYTEVTACDVGATCGYTCTCGNTYCSLTCMGLSCGVTCGTETCAASCDTCGATCFC